MIQAELASPTVLVMGMGNYRNGRLIPSKVAREHDQEAVITCRDLESLPLEWEDSIRSRAGSGAAVLGSMTRII